jgi:hypothetical protein
MPSPKVREINEIEAIRLWQERLALKSCLIDLSGRPIEVVYPGRINDSRGGDFRDALVTIGQENKSGCIEIHTHASNWQSHGHHLDPAYNQVVLHVALEGGRAFITRLQNGSSVPTVILDRLIHQQKREGFSKLAHRCDTTGRHQNMTEILGRAGEERFERQVQRYSTELGFQEADQVLYENILEALGYTRNKVPFRQLADRAPLKWLVKLGAGENSAAERLLCWQSVLWGLSGLLPSQRHLNIPGDEYIDKLETRWLNFSLTDSCPLVWDLYKVRPENYPVRRIAALSYLLLRNRDKGWLQTFEDLICQTDASRAHLTLEPALIITAEGYWANRNEFGPFQEIKSPVLLGSGRAGEILVNVVLPFFTAWSRINAKLELASAAREIFRHYPRLPENSLERHMLNQMNIDRQLVNSARLQQGLIQIYKTLCTQGKCAECELTDCTFLP